MPATRRGCNHRQQALPPSLDRWLMRVCCCAPVHFLPLSQTAPSRAADCQSKYLLEKCQHRPAELFALLPLHATQHLHPLKPPPFCDIGTCQILRESFGLESDTSHTLTHFQRQAALFLVVGLERLRGGGQHDCLISARLARADVGKVGSSENIETKSGWCFGRGISLALRE